MKIGDKFLWINPEVVYVIDREMENGDRYHVHRETDKSAQGYMLRDHITEGKAKILPRRR